MPNQLINLAADTVLSSAVTLALEGYESIWPDVHSLVRGLMHIEPAMVGSIFYLGNGTMHSCLATDFSEQAPAWFNKNRQRVALLGPIFSVINQHSISGDIAVFCHRPPVDLVDWLGSDILSHTLFITPDTDSFPRTVRTMPLDATPARLREELDNPVQEIRFGGSGFFPLRWQLENTDTSSRITINKNLEISLPLRHGRLSLHVQGIALADLPEISIRRRHGVATRVKLKTEQPWFPDIAWQEIPPSLSQVCRAILENEPFPCCHCGKNHPCSALLCPEINRPVLSGMPLDTWLLFKHDSYLPLANGVPAWPLAGNRRVITKQGKLYRADTGNWRFERQLQNSTKVDDHVWAVYNTCR